MIELTRRTALTTGGCVALTALVLSTIPTNAARVSYLVLFGLGSTLGMAAMSGLLGWPLARLGTHPGVTRSISLLVGCATTALGIAWGYPVVAQLFRACATPVRDRLTRTAESCSRRRRSPRR